MDSYFDSAIEYNRTNPISLARTSEQSQTVQNEKNWEWSYLVVSGSYFWMDLYLSIAMKTKTSSSGGKFYSAHALSLYAAPIFISQHSNLN